jgi:nicotinate phosphoribosyltransferase
MGVAALRGYEGSNDLALNLWEQIYSYEARIALTDTFSTQAFFQVRLFYYYFTFALPWT